MGVKRSQQEIDDVTNDAWESINEGTTRWRGMTYEQGVQSALDWVTGERDEGPFDEN